MSLRWFVLATAALSTATAIAAPVSYLFEGELTRFCEKRVGEAYRCDSTRIGEHVSAVFVVDMDYQVPMFTVPLPNVLSYRNTESDSVPNELVNYRVTLGSVIYEHQLPSGPYLYTGNVYYNDDRADVRIRNGTSAENPDLLMFSRALVRDSGGVRAGNWTDERSASLTGVDVSTPLNAIPDAFRSLDDVNLSLLTRFSLDFRDGYKYNSCPQTCTTSYQDGYFEFSATSSSIRRVDADLIGAVPSPNSIALILAGLLGILVALRVNAPKNATVPFLR